MNWIPIFFQGSVKEITGYTKTELFSGDITWDKIMVPEDLAAIGDKIKDLGTIPGFSVDRDYRIKRKDGEIRWVHDSIQNVCDDTGKPAFLQGIIYDITDRKSTELALKSSEEKYRLLAESADDIIFTLDSEGNFVYINNYGADMLGLPADRIISRSYTDVMPPELLTKMESLIAELTGPDEPLQRECQCQDRIIDMKVIAVRIPDIKKQGYLFIGRDISSRKKAELALRETFSLLNAALESTEDGILVINLQGKITHYNKKFTTIWNIPDQVLETGQDSVALDYVMSDIVDPDAFIRKVRYLYQHPGEESFDTFAFKDGTVIERFSKPQYLDGTIVGRVWSFRNVSGIYQIKEVLEQVNKKLHLLSEVTRHDILNEVGIIIGYLDLLGDALPDDPALKKDVPADPRCDRAHPEKDNLHPGLPATRSQSPAVAGSPENRRA
jgi:PAS domain S-box